MRDIDTLFRSLIANDVGVIDLAAEIFANKGGLLTADGRPMYHDDDHVSASGAMVLRRAIRPVFEQLTGSKAPEPGPRLAAVLRSVGLPSQPWEYNLQAGASEI